MTLPRGLRVKNRLGASGEAEIFVAYDSRFERRVVLRRIPVSAAAPGLRQLLGVRHRSLVQVYEVITADDDSSLLVTEYVAGRSLPSLIAEGPLDLELTIHLAREIAGGIAALHAAGLAHRDLRPENILVTPACEAKILDAGLASGHPTAPEQILEAAVDQRSDLFALGEVLYEMTTGMSPFADLENARARENIVSLRQKPAAEIDPRVPPALSALIDSLLSKRPADRPQSAAEVERSLAEIADQRWARASQQASMPSDLFEPTSSHRASDVLSELGETTSDATEIDELYGELRQLMARAAGEEAGVGPEIEDRLARLRRLQSEEAGLMRQRFESRLHLAPGAGLSALQTAKRLLDPDEAAAPADATLSRQD
jgi:serine/threonine protein kinase